MIMKNKIGVCIIVLLVFLAGKSFAQNGWIDGKAKSPEVRIEKKVTKLTMELGLSENQAQELTVILTSSQVQLMEINEKYSELESVKKEMKEVTQYKKGQMKSILSKEQLELMKERSKSKSNQKKGNGSGESFHDITISVLNLTEAQTAEIKVLNTEVENRKKDILEKYPEIKMAKEAIQKVKYTTQEELKGTLTPEQNKVYLTNVKMKRSKKKLKGN
ncbi:MAG: hypothetical protein ACI9GM_000414 [Salibacteraceae bacterium]|jgi:uncharacterized protein YsxB (DUF464 family)